MLPPSASTPDTPRNSTARSKLTSTSPCAPPTPGASGRIWGSPEHQQRDGSGLQALVTRRPHPPPGSPSRLGVQGSRREPWGRPGCGEARAGGRSGSPSTRAPVHPCTSLPRCQPATPGPGWGSQAGRRSPGPGADSRTAPRARQQTPRPSAPPPGTTYRPSGGAARRGGSERPGLSAEPARARAGGRSPRGAGL